MRLAFVYLLLLPLGATPAKHRQVTSYKKSDASIIPADWRAIWIDPPTFFQSTESNKNDSINYQYDNRRDISRQLEWIYMELGFRILIVPIPPYHNSTNRVDLNKSALELINLVAVYNSQSGTVNKTSRNLKIWLLIDFGHETNLTTTEVDIATANVIRIATTEANHIYPGTVTGILINFSNFAVLPIPAQFERIIETVTRILKSFMMPQEPQIGIILGEDDDDWCDIIKSDLVSWSQAMRNVNIALISTHLFESENTNFTTNICQKSLITGAAGIQLNNTRMVLEIRNDSTIELAKILPTRHNWTQESSSNGMVVMKGINLSLLWKTKSKDVGEGMPKAEARNTLVLPTDNWAYLVGMISLIAFGISVCYWCHKVKVWAKHNEEHNNGEQTPEVTEVKCCGVVQKGL